MMSGWFLLRTKSNSVSGCESRQSHVDERGESGRTPLQPAATPRVVKSLCERSRVREIVHRWSIRGEVRGQES